jgi:glycosyltransferase involved in cell wall biosynthesis
LPGVREVALKGGKVVPAGNPDALAEEILGYIMVPESEKLQWKQQVRNLVEENYAWKPIAKQLQAVYFDLI